MLGRLSHPNIVSLLGYCNDEKHEYLLVYSYINRSLGGCLYPEAPNTVGPLSWGTRLRIMIGVARGLTYLHSSKVIYRNVRSGSIFLDQEFNAKLGDFGLARSFDSAIGKTHVTTHTIATWGYMDPHYFETGHASAKSDTYGFGVVLLETLIGQQVSDAMLCDEEDDLLLWMIRFVTDKSELKKIMDVRLKENYSLEGAFKCAALAFRCLAFSPKDRPSSEEILRSLEHIYALYL